MNGWSVFGDVNEEECFWKDKDNVDLRDFILVDLFGNIEFY